SNTSDCPSYWGGKEFQHTNAFSGDIPSTIGNLKNLELFEARSQQFTGTIPETIGNMTNLKYLYLDNPRGENLLGGPIPISIRKLTKLVHLYISYDHGDGAGFTSFPSVIPEWSDISQIRMPNNSMTGDFPAFPNARDIRIYSVR